jgi:hypothetical protein
VVAAAAGLWKYAIAGDTMVALVRAGCGTTGGTAPLVDDLRGLQFIIRAKDDR